jgi:hypothetical protein
MARKTPHPVPAPGGNRRTAWNRQRIPSQTGLVARRRRHPTSEPVACPEHRTGRQDRFVGSRAMRPSGSQGGPFVSRTQSSRCAGSPGRGRIVGKPTLFFAIVQAKEHVGRATDGRLNPAFRGHEGFTPLSTEIDHVHRLNPPQSTAFGAFFRCNFPLGRSVYSANAFTPRAADRVGRPKRKLRSQLRPLLHRSLDEKDLYLRDPISKCS